MKIFRLVAPCHFGLEAVLKREIVDLGYEIDQIEDGRVSFTADAEGIVRANLCLRSAERVLLEAGRFHAETFEELFEGTKAIPWEELLPRDGKVWVKKAGSVKSKLFSPADIQRIVKKAIVERMKTGYHTDLVPETGASYPLRVTIRKDEVVIGMDTTGDSLHKRGYRLNEVQAPISETLASALIDLTPWQADRTLIDPFCGSGTILIEAARKAAGIAPGLHRHFLSETWENLIPREEWKAVREELREQILIPKASEVDLRGYDIDQYAVEAAMENAKRAGVASLIRFERRAVKDLRDPKSYGFIVTNPPYGERLEDRKAIVPIYKDFGRRLAELSTWSAYVITSAEDVETMMGRKADKNRKIYNGMIKTYLYTFQGPKPPKEFRQ